MKTTTGNVLLINPPVARPCEAPAGLAALAGALENRGVECTLWDANLEGLLHLINRVSLDSYQQGGGPGAEGVPGSRALKNRSWTRRALNQREANLLYLRTGRGAGGGGGGGARHYQVRPAGPGVGSEAGHSFFNAPIPGAAPPVAGYDSLGRYITAVKDLEHLLAVASSPAGVLVSLANYQDPDLQPVRSADLLYAAEHPEENVFYDYFSARLPGLIEGLGERPLVGFSIHYLSQALCAFAMIGFVRRHYPRVRVVAGGGLITSWCSRPGWRNPFSPLLADQNIIPGPGEEALLAMCGADPSPEEGVSRAAGDRGRIFLEYSFRSLPMGEYLSPGVVLPVSASTGCWWRQCAFCPEKAEGNPYYTMEPSRLLQRLVPLVRQYNPSLVHLLDNTVSPRLMEAMIRTPLGAPWFGFARFTPHLEDPSFCRDLAGSGCVMLQLGLESGDQRVLDQMGKGINLASAGRILENLKEAGILTYVYLLFGTPWEREEEAVKTMEYGAAHARYLDFLNVAVFNLPAWGSDAEGLETADFYQGDLTLYRSFRHPAGWSRGKVRRFIDRKFKRHPALGPILRRDPPVFTSSHAPFFTVP